ncbi:MAG: SH3 domain-containing protein [Lachnospiraceae bacterium]|nr:SH3 domain-containing protein [Lachnospiraceae bacterium]
MLNRRKKADLICLVMALAIAVLTSGCQLLNREEETESETQSETVSVVESETETETEFQTDVVYISEDGSIRIILPDSTWKVTQDMDEMRVFSSGSDAMINIVHASDEDSMKNVSVLESQELLEESLAGQYPEEDAFEVLSFEERDSSTLATYEYVVEYKYSTSMWAYSVTYALLSADGDAAYVITGTVTEDDEALLEEVQESVESFSVLDESSIFSVLPGTVENNTSSETEGENETEDDADSTGSAQLATLTEYSTSVTLYASTNVNIREQPSTESTRIGSFTAGASVTVTGETTKWFRVSVNGNVGYVSKAYLVSTQPDTDADTDDDDNDSDDDDTGSSSDDVSESTRTTAELNSEISYGTSYTYYATDTVNLRSQPGTDSSVLGSVASGDAVTVTGETDNWFIVSVGGTTGYISKSYLSSTQPTAADTSGETSSTADSSDTGTSTDAATDSNSDSTSSTGVVSGTITAVTSDTLLIEGDDGVTYSVNYQNASLSSSGLAEGLYVTATIDYSQSTSSGSLYATSVSGY